MREEYQAGMKARDEGKGVNACPYGMPEPEVHSGDKISGWEKMIQRRHWWLAGLHDRDMELTA